MTSRLLKSAAMALHGMPALHPQPVRVGTLVAHDGQMLEVEGFQLPVGSGVRITSASGSMTTGEVVGFRDA